MGADVFAFKQFTIQQGGASMKVNTDGVLLGAWFELQPDVQQLKILDVGCGVGVIALMAAQRFFAAEKGGYQQPPIIDAIDIDFHSCTLAKRNFEESPWSSCLCVYNAAFQNFTPQESEGGRDSYNVIVSNPPYFNNALKNPDERKSAARHTSELSHTELIEGAFEKLSEQGRLAVVLPVGEFEQFAQSASSIGLTLTRRCEVFTKSSDSSPRRILAEFTKGEYCTMTMATSCLKQIPKKERLSIMNEKLSYTKEYRELTSDFYLKF